MQRNNFNAMIMLPVCLLLCRCVWGSLLGEVSADALGLDDASECYGGLEVIYPELAVNSCLIVPNDDRKLPEKLTTMWGAPTIRYADALEDLTYLLVMVDPDAPSRISPTMAYWRHWLIANVQGCLLKNGDLQGITITDYVAPSPPKGTGFHRYQFLLYEQNNDRLVSRAELENAPRGRWDLGVFVLTQYLRDPVARVQFLMQNYKD